jgi:hypothetical protein
MKNELGIPEKTNKGQEVVAPQPQAVKENKINTGRSTATPNEPRTAPAMNLRDMSKAPPEPKPTK